MVTGLSLGITASSHFVVTAAAEVIRSKVGVKAISGAQIDTAQSKFGGSSWYGDGGDALEVVEDFDWDGNEWTVEMWVRPTTLDNTFHLLDMREVGNTSVTHVAGIHVVSGSYYMAWYNGSAWVTNGSALSTGTWYHMAWEKSGTTVTMYLDGTNVGTSSVSATENNCGYTIGARYSNYSNGFKGHIDEVRLSTVNRYSGSFTAPTEPFANDANTALLLHMDGTDGSTYFPDDNGVRAPVGIGAANSVQVDTAQSKFGGASALFETTTDDYIILYGNESNVDFSGDFTIECFFRSTDVASNRKIFDARGIYSTHAGGDTVVALGGTILIDHNASAIRVFLDGGDKASGSTTVSNDTWHHIAVTRSSGTVNAWLDGTRIVNYSHTDDFTNVFNVNQPIGVGASTSTLSQKFDGHIDEFRITTDARYTLGTSITVPTAPFVNDSTTYLLLHMDGTDTSTDFIDDNGKGRSAVGVSANGDAQVDTADSKFGGASALFDGIGDYLYVEEDVCAFGTGDFTIEAWINLDTTGNMCIVDGRGSGTSNYFIVLSSKLSWSNGSVYRQSTNTLSTGTWYHVAVSRSSGTLKLFIDGTEEGSWDDSTVSVTGDYSYIGRSKANTIPFDGHIDEMRISNTGRYTTGFTPSTTAFQNDANTALLLHMDGTDGSTTFNDDNGTY